MTCQEESGVSDSTHRGTVSQCIPIKCKLYFPEVYQVLCGKSKKGKRPVVKGSWLGLVELKYSTMVSMVNRDFHHMLKIPKHSNDDEG